MHTTETLVPEHFRCARAAQPPGRPGDLEPLFAGFTDQDRVGIVSPRPLEGIQHVGYAVLACVTAFYEMRRGELSGSTVYPDYFLFYDSASPAADAWGELDVWPAARWVPTDGSPARMLAAATDRGVTRLLWPESLPLPTILPGSTLRSIYTYGPKAAGLSVSGAQPVEDLIVRGLTRVPGLSPASLEAFHLARAARTPDAQGWRLESLTPVALPRG